MKLHIERCRVVTARYRRLFRYHVSDSVAFLDTLPSRSVDLMYLDAGDVNESGALLQLREAQSVVERHLLTRNGTLVIDDVAHKNVETAGLGKGKYAVPFLLSNGYDILFKGYQYVLGKKEA